MEFDFGEQLSKGKEAADNVLKNRKEVVDIMNDLKTSLQDFLEVEIEYEERVEFKKTETRSIDIQAVIFGGSKPREKTGFNILVIKN